MSDFMGGGWIKLHRSMLKWEWWKDERMVQMFVYLLLSCNSEPGVFHGVTVLPGEVIVGRKMLSERLDMPERVVRSTLDKLVSTGEITKWSNNHFTKVTVRNWEKYQSSDDANNKSNYQPTNRQPVVQPELGFLHSKNSKNQAKHANQLSNKPPTTCPTTCHKQEERSYKESISDGDTKESSPASQQKSVTRKRKDRPESPEEVVEYCRSRGNNIDGRLFYDKMEARGWVFKDGRPVKDWRACIRTWERYDQQPIANPSKANPPARDEAWKGKTNQMEEKDIGGAGFL